MELDLRQPSFAGVAQDGRLNAMLPLCKVIVGDEDGVAPTDAVLCHAIHEADIVVVMMPGRQESAVVQASMRRGTRFMGR